MFELTTIDNLFHLLTSYESKTLRVLVINLCEEKSSNFDPDAPFSAKAKVVSNLSLA